MITIYQYPQTDCGFQETGKNELEYSCPHCCHAIKWETPGQMSPYNCLACGEKIIDASSVISTVGFRVNYHLKGSRAIKCSSFGQF